MKREILTLMSILGCAHSEQHQASLAVKQEETASTESREVLTERVQTGPETITTTVREFAPPKEVMPSAEQRQRLCGSRECRSLEVQVTRGAAGEVARGPLVKETVTVDQRGPAVQESTLNASTASQSDATAKVEAQTKDKSSTRWGPPWWAYALLGVGLACGGWLLWKLKWAV